jgi:hypothetical protein
MDFSAFHCPDKNAKTSSNEKLKKSSKKITLTSVYSFGME